MSTEGYLPLAELKKAFATKGYVVYDKQLPSETSLVSPTDKGERKKVRVAQLSEEVIEEAINEMVVKNLVDKFPKVDRYWQDPQYRDQVFCLSTWVPASGAKPDKNGIYGQFKVRGVYPTREEMDDHAEQILRAVDSYHVLIQSHVGAPRPCTDNDEKYCRETRSIDIRNDAIRTVSEDVKKKKEKEMKEKEDIVEREQELLRRNEEVKAGQNHHERYTELRVKRANILYTIINAKQKLRQFLQTLERTNVDLHKMDLEHPECRETYLEHYNKACEEVGIEHSHNSLIKYMVGDTPFDLEVLRAFVDDLPAELPQTISEVSKAPTNSEETKEERSPTPVNSEETKEEESPPDAGEQSSEPSREELTTPSVEIITEPEVCNRTE